MKSCPRCRRQYPEGLDFCLEDGAPLTEDADPSVMTVYPARNAASTPRRRRSGILGLVILGGLLLLGVIVLVGAGVGGLYYYQSTRSARPQATSTPYPSPRITETATPMPHTSRTPSSPYPANDATPGPAPKQISGGVLNGKAVSLPKPSYPPAARAVRAAGAVNVQVLVDEEGSVVSANAVSGHPLLRAAAVQAARSAKFAPTMLAGKPVRVSGIIIYNFEP